MDRQAGWGMTLDDDGSWRKGPWTAQEDKLLIQHVNLHGEGKWKSVSKFTGLRRSGKSCRLRWVNYLRPDLKRGNITAQEEIIIQELHALWGNRWSAIARHLPGRTDNEIKNYWRTHFKKSKPSKSVQKARASFLLRQQQQRERRLLLQRRIKLDQQKQHEQQLQQEDVEREAGEAETRGSLTAMKQVDQAASLEEMAALYNITMDHCLVLGGYRMSDGGSTEEEPEEDDDSGSWGCLWNLDDLHSHNLQRAS